MQHNYTVPQKALHFLYIYFFELLNLVASKNWLDKNVVTSKLKVREICHQYLNKLEKSPVGDLQCNACDVLVKCGKNVLRRTIKKVSFTKLNRQPTSSSQGKQT